MIERYIRQSIPLAILSAHLLTGCDSTTPTVTTVYIDPSSKETPINRDAEEQFTAGHNLNNRRTRVLLQLDSSVKCNLRISAQVRNSNSPNLRILGMKDNKGDFRATMQKISGDRADLYTFYALGMNPGDYQLEVTDPGETNNTSRFRIIIADDCTFQTH